MGPWMGLGRDLTECATSSRDISTGELTCSIEFKLLENVLFFEMVVGLDIKEK